MRTPSDIIGLDNVSKLQRQGYVIISKDQFFHLRRALQVVVDGVSGPQAGEANVSSLVTGPQRVAATSRPESQSAAGGRSF